MEGSFFEKKLEAMSKNFSFKSLAAEDRDYLILMLNEVKNATRCPKTFVDFEDKYPNAKKYQFFLGQAPEGSTSYGSHLLNGLKYYLTWEHD